jgi:hypothetical protein
MKMAKNELKERIKELAGILDTPITHEKLDSFVAKLEKPEIKNRVKDGIKFIADYINK